MTALVMLGLAAYGLPLALWSAAARPPLSKAAAQPPHSIGFALAGASFLLGAGAVSLHLFALSVARVPWTRVSVLIAIAPLFLIACLFARRPDSEARVSALDLLLLIPIAAYAIFALYAPPFEWDFYGVWGIKGRWFFDAHGIDWTWLATNSAHPDYPLLLPLVFDFTAIMTGAWSDASFGWIYVALCVSFVLIAREHSSPLVALAVVFPALNPWIGLGEAAVMAFGCAGLLFLRREQYGIGAVMLGLAAWSKNEGFALIIAAALALLITRRKILVLWPALVLIAPWMIVRRVLQLPTDLGHGQVLERVLFRLQHPVITMRELATAPPDQPYLWLAILAILLIYGKAAWQRERFLLLALVLQAGAFLAAIFATPFELAGHAQFSLNRIPHQIAPAAAFLAAILVTRGLSAPSPSAGSPPPPRPSTD